MKFFHIPNRTMRLSKKIYTKILSFFCPAWDSSFSESILYVIT